MEPKPANGSLKLRRGLKVGVGRINGEVEPLKLRRGLKARKKSLKIITTALSLNSEED